MKYWKAVRKINKNTFQTGGIGGSENTTFEIGKTYQVPGDPVLCKNGFHFYRKQDFVFGIELFGAGETEFIEIEPLGKTVSDTEKHVCCKIKVLRYVPKRERQKLLKDKANSGDYNSGNRNSGNLNSGNRNSGNCNSGNCNSGNLNSGDGNSGYRNSGHFNSGDYNSGHNNSGNRNSGNCNSGNRNSRDCNSGDCNSGYRNSGHFNSGDYNSGYYNSGNRNSGSFNSGNYNSGNGYRNYACKKTKYFLFDLEVTKKEIQEFNNLMSWFDLENKSYKEAWAECPSEILEELMKLKVLQTKEGKENFPEITGLSLPKE